MARLPKWIFRFNVTSIKIPAGLFKETDELVLKFTRKFTRTIILKSMLRGKKKAAELTLVNLKPPNLNLNCKAPVIKTV